MTRYIFALIFSGLLFFAAAQPAAVELYSDPYEAVSVDSLAVDSLAVDSVIVVVRNLETYKEHLTSSVDSLLIGSVAISEDKSAAAALLSLQQRRDATGDLLDGYRVGVYFDNSAAARARALWVVEQCKLKMPYVIPTMSYDNPYFKVALGYCVSLEEAVILLNKVQRHFPKAYLMREQFSPQKIAEAHQYEEDVRNGVLITKETETEVLQQQ